MGNMLRFGKQRLLMGSFQTPDVEHEELDATDSTGLCTTVPARELVDNLPRLGRSITTPKIIIPSHLVGYKGTFTELFGRLVHRPFLPNLVVVPREGFQVT
jgi:hypothetical protein